MVDRKELPKSGPACGHRACFDSYLTGEEQCVLCVAGSVEFFEFAVVVRDHVPMNEETRAILDRFKVSAWATHGCATDGERFGLSTRFECWRHPVDRFEDEDWKPASRDLAFKFAQALAHGRGASTVTIFIDGIAYTHQVKP